jgi:hypothetical protein
MLVMTRKAQGSIRATESRRLVQAARARARLERRRPGLGELDRRFAQLRSTA